KSESDTDKLGAYATLYECLTTVAKLIAPTMPFVSDALYRNLVASVDADAPESVHLAFFPEYDPALIDRELIDSMRVVQRLVSLGSAARATVKLGVRQHLASARFAVRDAKEAAVVTQFAELIGAELNVKEVTQLERAGRVVRYRL